MVTAQAWCSSAARDGLSAALAKVLAEASKTIAAEPMILAFWVILDKAGRNMLCLLSYRRPSLGAYRAVRWFV